ncbi:hypothetical protein MLD38_033019 [Melastoma candidum]|uniref:Uncharacterized protein n=1 Tax=Melastoma candidum TaxID=119954 RepID=A0ACB9M5K2_9MYRT|nr:hypothetical protein MLD38_033019 [Melastoma candidum]
MAAPDLCPDVVVDILSWLPSKALIRASTACRRWTSLLSQEYFRHLHARKFSPQPAIVVETVYPSEPGRTTFVCVDSEGSEFRFSMEFLEGLSLRASCHGILCFLIGTKFHVCNPFTKRAIPLPDIMDILDNHPQIQALRRELEVGMVYDAPNGTYEVVVVGRCQGQTPHGWQERFVWFAFKSGLATWTVNFSSGITPFPLLGNQPGVFVRRCCHWLEGGRRILTIDVTQGIARLRNAPGHLPKTELKTFYLAELDRRLSVIEATRKIILIWRVKIWVWDMKRPGDWMMIYTQDNQQPAVWRSLLQYNVSFASVN